MLIITRTTANLYLVCVSIQNCTPHYPICHSTRSTTLRLNCAQKLCLALGLMLYHGSDEEMLRNSTILGTVRYLSVKTAGKLDMIHDPTSTPRDIQTVVSLLSNFDTKHKPYHLNSIEMLPVVARSRQSAHGVLYWMDDTGISLRRHVFLLTSRQQPYSFCAADIRSELSMILWYDFGQNSKRTLVHVDIAESPITPQCCP